MAEVRRIHRCCGGNSCEHRLRRGACEKAPPGPRLSEPDHPGSDGDTVSVGDTMRPRPRLQLHGTRCAHVHEGPRPGAATTACLRTAMRLLLFLASIVSLVFSLHSPCIAVAATPSLRWDAPAGCGERSQLEAQLAQVIAEQSRAPSEVDIDGRVERTARGFHLHLVVHIADKRSVRDLTASDCDSLLQTTSWLLRLALVAEQQDADAPSTGQAKLENETQHGGTRLPRPPGASTIDDSNLGRAVVRKSPDAVRWRIGVLTGGIAAGLSGVEWSGGARAGLRWSNLLLELAAIAHLGTAHALEVPGADAHVTFQSQELNVTGCWVFGAAMRAGPCAFMAVLRTSGSSSGISAGQDNAMLWAASGLSVSVGYSASDWVELRWDAGAFIPLSARPSFQVEVFGSPQTVGEASVVGGFARLGVDLVLR